MQQRDLFEASYEEDRQRLRAEGWTQLPHLVGSRWWRSPEGQDWDEEDAVRQWYAR
jgi:hypothetical protein